LDLLDFGFGKIGLIGFLVDSAELDFFRLDLPIVDNPLAAAFAFPSAGHTDFPQAFGTWNEIAGIRPVDQKVLQLEIILLAEDFLHGLREGGRFAENHGVESVLGAWTAQLKSEK
jgi:hypothetical protein